MPVNEIERCKNGVIVVLSNGWFICSSEDMDLVRNYSWTVKGNRITAVKSKVSHVFSREVLFKRHGLNLISSLNPAYYNFTSLDNRASNLFPINNSAVSGRREAKGYLYSNRKELLSKFHAQYGSNQAVDIRYLPDISSPYRNREDLCLVDRSNSEAKNLESNLRYNPAKDMSKNIDLLLREVRGELTKEQIYIERLFQVAKNPWYILRYGLQEDCIKYGISISDYTLDKLGFMCNKSGIRLCPDLPSGLRQEGLF